MIIVDYTPRKIEAAKDILKHPEWDHYFLLDMKYAMYQTERFGFAIEILNTMNFMANANKMLKDLGSKKKIETHILLHAVDHVIKEKPFNEAQLKDWFGFWQEFEDLNEKLQDIYDSDSHYVNPGVSYVLMGLTHKEIKEFNENKRFYNLHEEYGDLKYKMVSREIDIETFLDRAREIFTEVKEPVKE